MVEITHLGTEGFKMKFPHQNLFIKGCLPYKYFEGYKLEEIEKQHWEKEEKAQKEKEKVGQIEKQL